MGLQCLAFHRVHTLFPAGWGKKGWGTSLDNLLGDGLPTTPRVLTAVRRAGLQPAKTCVFKGLSGYKPDLQESHSPIDKKQQNHYYDFEKTHKVQQKSTKGQHLTTYGRRQSLLDILRKQPGLRVPELAIALDVSEGTVRNDLNALEKQGVLMRVHGGAVLNQQDQFQN